MLSTHGMDKPIENLRIAYFIDRLIRGGTELQLVEQINQLAKVGIEQELFCLYKSSEHDQLRIDCKGNILEIKKLISIRTLAKCIKLIRYIRQRKFTIIQTYFFDSTIVGIICGKIARTGALLSCRRDLGFWYSPLLLFCLKLVNKISDGFIVNCISVRENVVKKEGIDPRNIIIMPNGINSGRFKYSALEKERNRIEFGLEDKNVCIGIIANMSRSVKRVDLFIKMAAYVLKRRTEIRFLILGDGELKDRLVEMTKRFGIAANVLFLGRDVSKHKVLSAMDVGVLTSDSEAFSNAIMEYMAAGLPTVATDVGGNGELLENSITGVLVPASDFKALGDKVLQLADNENQRHVMGLKARESVLKYDWDILVGIIIQHYGSLVRKNEQWHEK